MNSLRFVAAKPHVEVERIERPLDPGVLEELEVRGGAAVAVAHHDMLGDRLEAGAEMLTRLDEDELLAARIDAATLPLHLGAFFALCGLLTGEAHWHTLLRARAIETGCFVFAAAQAGLHENKRETFGHSLIIDPWGEILAEGGVEPGVFLAEIDPAKVETARKTIPSLQHGRRFGIADPKAGPEHLHLVRGSA